MSDIYEAPSADLTTPSQGNIFAFNRFSAWYVFILSIITLSIYVPYWLYTRTQILNTITDNKISTVFLNITIMIYVGHH